MEVVIQGPQFNMTAQLTKEQVDDIIKAVLAFVDENPEVKTPPIHIPVIPPMNPGKPVKKEEAPIIGDDAKEFVKPVSTEPKAFKGFMYVQCEECKGFKGFMPKSPISEYRCNCGHITKLQDMRPMFVQCKCGQKFKYLTNAKDKYVSMNCFSCGAPIDLEYHDRNQVYSTIKDEM